MDKRELKEKTGELPQTFLKNDRFGVTEILVSLKSVDDLIDQLDEPEKELDKKINTLDLDFFIKTLERNGYTVEEKKYRVPMPNTDQYLYVLKYDGVYVYDFGTWGPIEHNSDITAIFTEKEIKDIDPNYWPFAKEVTE